MASVIHPTTKELLRSVNTPDYTSNGWIVVPEEVASGMELVPPEHRLTDRVMTEQEIATEDVSLLPVLRKQKMRSLRQQAANFASDNELDGFEATRNAFRLAEARRTGNTGLINRLSTFETAVLDLGNAYDTAGSGVAAATTREDIQNVTLDISGIVI